VKNLGFHNFILGFVLRLFII